MDRKLTITALSCLAVLVALLAVDYRPARAFDSSGLVSCWDLDETSGTRYDSVGGNDLTDNNTVSYTTGKIGNAASFTAANSEYLSVTSSDFLVGTGGMSVVAWVQYTAGVYGIFAGTNTANTVGWRFSMPNANTAIRFTTGNNIFGTRTTALNTWYMVFVYWDPNTQVGGISVNDGQRATANYDLMDDGSFVLGGTPSISSKYLTGYVDQVAFFSRVLSSGEVTDLYNSGSGRDCAYINTAPTPTPTATTAPTSTPTPAVTSTPAVIGSVPGYTYTLSSGQVAVIQQVTTYGDVAVTSAVLLVLLFVVVIGAGVWLRSYL
jgi:hypothetical protein